MVDLAVGAGGVGILVTSLVRDLQAVSALVGLFGKGTHYLTRAYCTDYAPELIPLHLLQLYTRGNGLTL
jgi:fructose-1-phosphate kinase PfkB-like protein